MAVHVQSGVRALSLRVLWSLKLARTAACRQVKNLARIAKGGDSPTQVPIPQVPACVLGSGLEELVREKVPWTETQ